uniref:Uncharacterized protein n=1 Tax=Salix viminalis TaxID=40686 RepID=A0A6N2KNF1_SALVM
MIQSLVEFCGHRREDRRASYSRRRPWNRKIEFDCCSILPNLSRKTHLRSFHLLASHRSRSYHHHRHSCQPSKSWKVHTIEFILGKAFSENHDLTVGEHYAVNGVDQLGGGRAGSFSSICLRLELHGTLFHAVVLFRAIRRLLFCEIPEDSEKNAIQ